MKTGGGTGGHNGLKSVSAHMRDGYRRLRIGVGHPGRKEMVPAYVLHDFAKADHDWLEPMLNAFAEEAPLLVGGQDAAFASRVHGRLGGGARTKPQQPPVAPSARSDASAPQKNGTNPFAALAQLLRK